MSASSLPNRIIAGVNKAGTTSLYAYLAQHPQIGASAVKETCHYLPLRYGEPMPGPEDYRKQFEAVADRPVRFESTPGYFYGGRTLIDGLRRDLGEELKIILIFREPVNRLISFFNFKKSTLELPGDMTLGEYVERCQAMDAEVLRKRDNNPWFGLEGGKYADYVSPWLDAFGDRLKVLFTDDLHADTRGVLRELFTFVGVAPAAADSIELTRENKGTDYRFAPLQRIALAMNHAGETFWRSHPKWKRSLRRLYYALNGRTFEKDDDPAALEALRAFYEPYNARLAEQLRAAGIVKLPTWLTAERAGVDA